MSPKLLTLLLATALAAIPLSSCAQSGGGALLERADRDGDGAISLQELTARGSERFAQLDGNGDGRLDADETAAARDALPQRRGGGGMEGRLLARADTDGDGALSQAEYADAMRTMFARLDGDGVITREELQAVRQRMGGRRGGR